MRRWRFSAWKQFVAVLAIVSVLPSPLLFLPSHALKASPPAAGGNPTEEDRDRMRAEYKAYLEKEKKEGQERRKKILDAHEANWRPIEQIAPYWKQGDGFASTLVINNTQPRAVEITTLVRAADGHLLQSRPITIQPTGSMDVPLATLIGDQEGYGQIGLRYEGEPLEINAVLVVADAARSLSVDHPFEKAEDFSSSELEGVFYLPRSSTRAELALTNTSGAVLAASIEVQPENAGAADRVIEHVAILPYQTQIVNVRPLLRASNGLVPIAARVLVSHTGKPADLRLHGMLLDATGYSANMRFLERSALGGNKLFSPILPLQDPASPIVVLTNTNSSAATVHLEAYYTLNGELEETTLRTVSVPADGALHVDLSGELRGLPAGASEIGLVLEHYKDGGLLADVLLLDGSESAVYQVSPKGYLGHAHNSHSFPFRLDGTVNTILTVANPSETEEILYSINLYYEGKVYGVKTGPLRPGEVRNINIKELRYQQTPGLKKELLPSELAGGHATLHFRRRKKPAGAPPAHHEPAAALGIASAATFDAAGKVAFVTCWPDCDPENWTLEFVNQYYVGVVGDSYIGEITAYNVNYGYLNLEDSEIEWYVDGWPVASASGNYVELVSAGSAEQLVYVTFIEDWCYGECLCTHVFGPEKEFESWVESYDYSVTITGYNFENPDPANDTVTVVANGPPWDGTLTVQVTSDEGPTVTLYQETVGPDTYQIAFHPPGESMPAGTWTSISASYSSPPVTFQISPPRIDTNNFVVVSWVDESLILLPSGANGALVASLNSVLTCFQTLLAWQGGNPTLINNSIDIEYANKWLVKNAPNAAPPNTLSPSVLAGGDYRMYNAFQATFRRESNGNLSGVRNKTLSPILGTTPVPCGFAPNDSTQPHMYHGAIGNKPLSGLYQIGSGRLGTDGRLISQTINQRTVAWIWTVVGFNGPSGALVTSSLFPKHTVYVNGVMSYSTTPDLMGFIGLDENSQIDPSSIP